MNTPKMTVVAGCVLKRDGKYLLVQERKSSASGLWNLPAGHVHEGEPIRDAAIREVKEETGFDVVLIAELKSEVLHEKHLELHAFAAEIMGGELRFNREELMDAQWFDIDKIRQLDQDGQIRGGWASRAIEQVI